NLERLREGRPGRRVGRACRPAVLGVKRRLVPVALVLDVPPDQPVRNLPERVGDVLDDDGQRPRTRGGRSSHDHASSPAAASSAASTTASAPRKSPTFAVVSRTTFNSGSASVSGGSTVLAWRASRMGRLSLLAGRAAGKDFAQTLNILLAPHEVTAAV